MRLTVFVSLALIVTLSLAMKNQDDTSVDLISQAEGEWVVISSTGEHKRGMVFAEMMGTPISIKNRRISWVENWGVDANDISVWTRVSRNLVLVPKVAVNAVDIDAGHRYKAWSRVGIMHIDGDFMDLCVNVPQGPRPSEFKDANDGRELVRLRRVHNLDK